MRATMGDLNRALRALDRRAGMAESAGRLDIAAKIKNRIRAAQRAAKQGRALTAYEILTA